MTARIIIAGIILSLAAGLWHTINSAAETSAALKQEKARSGALAKQVAGVAAEYQKRLSAVEEGYRVRDSRRQEAESRKDKAEAMFQRAGSKARDWGNTITPDSVTDSLCIKPGSCTGEVSGTTKAAGGAVETGAGDAVTRKLRLTNNSLRKGINDCRADLGKANAQLAGLCAWCERDIGDCDCGM